ncbi:hypothetical protein ES705_27046 [subsurface metagenome]
MAIYSEYFTAEVIDGNNLKFTFLDSIPATGNGYYKVSIWKVIEDVDPYFTEIFYSDFSSWTEGEPDGWIVEEPLFGSATIVNDNNRCKFINDALGKVKIIPDVTITANTTYRISLKLDQGDLLIKSAFIQSIISFTGEYSFYFTPKFNTIKISSNTAATSILDWVKIETVS